MLSQCRWGILGTATIARKNWRAIRLARSATLAAVASRTRVKAESFVESCQAQVSFPVRPKCYGSYEELINDAEIEAIYLPLPTGLRAPWAIRVAERGKHVLLEKPAAICLRELKTIADACTRNRVQLMDGVMFMHSRRLPLLRHVLDDPTRSGAIRRIDSHFCFHGREDFFSRDIRMEHRLEPLGCVGDLGWYCVRAVLWIMNWQLPRQVSGVVLRSSPPDSAGASVPLEFRGELWFDEGITAGFYCSFITAAEQWLSIATTTNRVLLDDFVLPNAGSQVALTTCHAEYEVTGCDFVMRDHCERLAVREDASGTENSQEAQMFECFSKLVLSKVPDREYFRMALLTQQVVDGVLASARECSGNSVEIDHALVEPAR